MPTQQILLGHGSGGRLMHDLIKGLFLEKFNNPILKELSDSAVISRINHKIAFTTDSFVVSPLFFPGGDIGKLSVYGTANDLVMLGARPEYLSLAMIIEEGFEFNTLGKILDSIASASKIAGVDIVTGDTKVVEKGACDKIFINTSGIGSINKKQALSLKNIERGDKVILSGDIGCHGLAVLAKRKNLGLDTGIKSDCAYLGGLLLPALKDRGAVKFMRDPTRGGLAATLNEIVSGIGMGMVIKEGDIPISAKVKSGCELLGIDPLYMACEGRAVLVVKPAKVNNILNLLRRHPLGKQAREIGVMAKEPKGRLVMDTVIGTQRIVDMLVDEPLPRIC